MNEKLALHGGEPVRETPLPAAYPGALVYGEEEVQAALAVIRLQSPYRFYGPDLRYKVKQFEDSFSQKIGNKHSLGVTSGTAALIVALKAAGIGPGDKVIVPACTFLATAGAVICAGAVPVFADIDESLNIDPDAIDKVVDRYTKAVIPVPIMGNPCQMDRIMEKAKKHNLVVVEDVAQSCGSKYKGRYSGTYGHINAFSLQINKILTTGDGGVVSTNDEKLYERAVRYHDQGMFREKEGFLATNANDDIFIGQNYRMNEISGAIAVEQLKKLDFITGEMHKIKYSIKDRLADIDGLRFRRINDREGDAGNALIALLPTKPIAQEFRKALIAENIPTNCIYNGEPVYMIPQLFDKRTVDKNGFPFNQIPEEIIYTKDMCPVAVELMQRNISINLCPAYTERDADDIVNAIRKVAKHLL